MHPFPFLELKVSYNDEVLFIPNEVIKILFSRIIFPSKSRQQNFYFWYISIEKLLEVGLQALIFEGRGSYFQGKICNDDNVSFKI